MIRKKEDINEGICQKTVSRFRGYVLARAKCDCHDLGGFFDRISHPQQFSLYIDPRCFLEVDMVKIRLTLKFRKLLISSLMGQLIRWISIKIFIGLSVYLKYF